MSTLTSGWINFRLDVKCQPNKNIIPFSFEMTKSYLEDFWPLSSFKLRDNLDNSKNEKQNLKNDA